MSSAPQTLFFSIYFMPILFSPFCALKLCHPPSLLSFHTSHFFFVLVLLCTQKCGERAGWLLDEGLPWRPGCCALLPDQEDANPALLCVCVSLCLVQMIEDDEAGEVDSALRACVTPPWSGVILPHRACLMPHISSFASYSTLEALSPRLLALSDPLSHSHTSSTTRSGSPGPSAAK